MDGELIAAAQNGDEGAFLALYERHSGRVRRQVERWVGDSTLADDLCQESWLRAFRGMEAFRGDAEFGTWMHTIVRNVVASRRRRRSRRAEMLDASWTPKTSSLPEPVELRLDLRRAVDALPAGMRRVIWLHDVEGWTHADIGAALGVSAGTSKSQLFKARARLREVLRTARA